jgi:hypothetical protein
MYFGLRSNAQFLERLLFIAPVYLATLWVNDQCFNELAKFVLVRYQVLDNLLAYLII